MLPSFFPVRGCVHCLCPGAIPSDPPLAWLQVLTRMKIARSHGQRRDWRQPRSALARQLRWARTRARADPVAARLRSMSCDSSRATCLHAFLRRLRPETRRHRTREPRDHAAPSHRRTTTRGRLAGGFRRTGGQRPSFRAISAPVRGAISARVPPSSPSRHTRSTQVASHTPLRAHNTQTHPS